MNASFLQVYFEFSGMLPRLECRSSLPSLLNLWRNEVTLALLIIDVRPATVCLLLFNISGLGNFINSGEELFPLKLSSHPPLAVVLEIFRPSVSRAFKAWAVFTILLSYSRCRKLSSRWICSSFCCRRLSSFLLRAIAFLNRFSLYHFDDFPSREECMLCRSQKPEKEQENLAWENSRNGFLSKRS